MKAPRRFRFKQHLDGELLDRVQAYAKRKNLTVEGAAKQLFLAGFAWARRNHRQRAKRLLAANN